MDHFQQNPVNLQTPFGKTVDYLGKYMEDYAFRDYAPRKVPHPFGPLDKSGIPLFDLQNIRLQGIPVYHPIVIIQYALAHHTLWLEGDAAAWETFSICNRWLEENAVPDERDRFLVWEYPFPLRSPRIPAHWISGMAQGQGLSVLARAYQRTGSCDTAEISRRVAASFRFSLEEGGVLSRFPGGGQFIEEVAHPPVLHILNGHLYALIGIYEYLCVFEDPYLQHLLLSFIQGTEETLPMFDTGWWSRYSLGMRWHLAPLEYHIIHILQLRYLAKALNNHSFAQFAEKWDAYLKSRQSRMYSSLLRFIQLNTRRACTVLHLDNIKYSTSGKK